MEPIRGKVIHGERKGRGLGFPTANIKTYSKKQAEPGIYSGIVIFESIQHYAALYIREDGIIEAHLLDFSGDLYDKEVDILIGEKVRANLAFKNEEEAIRKIKNDILVVREQIRKLAN